MGVLKAGQGAGHSGDQLPSLPPTPAQGRVGRDGLSHPSVDSDVRPFTFFVVSRFHEVGSEPAGQMPLPSLLSTIGPGGTGGLAPLLPLTPPRRQKQNGTTFSPENSKLF